MGRRRLGARERGRRALIAVAALFTAIVMHAIPPASLSPGPCAFKQVTGLSCLSCGMTRSVHAAASGDLAAAVQYHPVGPLALAGILLFGVVAGIEAVSGRSIAAAPSKRVWVPAVVVVASGWLVFAVVRAVLEILRR
jgi:hypothetical protein